MRQYEEAIRGVVIQLESLERHPYLAFIVENPADSALWSPPEVLPILQRGKDWAIREVDRCAYIREGGAETDKVPHEQTGVGAKRKDRERQVLRGGAQEI